MNITRTKFISLMVVWLLTFAVSGCGHILDAADLHDETIYPATLPPDNPPPPKTNGTIYQAGHEISLYQDHIASRIGDILTVRLEEQTQGQKGANTKAHKTNSYITNNGTGTDGQGLTQPILFGRAIKSLAFNLGTDLQFDGKGETNENNKLQGTVSVTVTQVLSNGNLLVRGESWITINQGREYVRLIGLVRSEDIEPGNVVSSQRIADARISYSGSGQVGNASRGGLITQFLYKFFPY